MVNPIVIPSFTEKAFLKVLASDFLYPSNKETTSIPLLFIDKIPSLYETIVNDHELFNAKDVTSYTHAIGKVPRIFLRAISLTAISTFISPIGFLYNTGMAISWYVRHLNSINKEDQELLLSMGKKHAAAALTDLFFSAINIISIAIILKNLSFSSVKNFKASINTFSKDFKQVTNVLAIFGSIILIAVDPKIMAHLSIKWNADMAGFYKAVALRNEFGLVDHNGELLKYNAYDYDERFYQDGQVDGQMSEIRDNQAGAIVDLICKIQDKIPEANRRILKFPPNKDEILSYLNKHKEQFEYYDSYVTELTNLFKNYERIQNLLSEILSLNKCNTSKLKPFPSEPYLNSWKKTTIWQGLMTCKLELRSTEVEAEEPELDDKWRPLNSKLESLHKLATKTEECPAHDELVKAIFTFAKNKDFLNQDLEVQAYQILGFDKKPTTPKEINERYRKCQLLLHPDKPNYTFDICKGMQICLAEAREYLFEKYKFV